MSAAKRGVGKAKAPRKKKPEAPRPAEKRVTCPTKYKSEYAEQAKERCQGGATDSDLAEEFGVTRATIHNWQITHPEFRQALKLGKDEADNRVERSLYQRAVGHGDVPGEVTAQIFWLKNRRKDRWRDRSQHEHSGPDGGPIETKIEGGMSDREAARVIARFLLTAEKAADPPAEEKPETAPDADIDSGAEPS